MVKSRESLSIYMKQISKHKLLSSSQEILLSQMIEGEIDNNGIKTVVSENEKKLAKRKMIETNLRLVISIAKSYQNRGCDLEDLISEGNIGLIKAVELFDWRKGFRFSTYATWWIKQHIGRLITNQGKVIKVPNRINSMLEQLNKIRDEFIELNGQEPSRAELAAIMGVTESTISTVVNGMPYMKSLDAETNLIKSNSANQISLKNSIPDNSQSPFDAIDSKEIIDQVSKVLESLTSREKLILQLRFGLGSPPEEKINFLAKKESKELQYE